ncbi:MAG: WYL domain-containing protein [Rhodospirillaceae bacterium]|nr:WYL domain-containing protein [Rhodospirillaceae bacterium]
MRWGVEKRLTFIEFRLFWEGGINRADIIGQFGVSVPQASKDLRLYADKAPANLVYDKSAKRYLAGSEFTPVFLRPDSNSYLTQLQSEPTPGGTTQETWLSSVPDFGVMPIPHRRIDAYILRPIVAAVRNNRCLEIRYQSMNPSRPLPLWRRITPHAFGNDGLRWHVRAFCHIDRKFKDFILSRCLNVRSESKPGTHPETDTYWVETFDVTLVPNPLLNEDQRKVIARDYRMEKGRVSIPVRKALLYYFQKRLRLDVSDELDEPYETPIVVSNRVEFDAALREAML